MKQNLKNENLWYEQNPWIRKNHFLMRWPFVNPRRNEYAYKVARQNTRQILSNFLSLNETIIPKNALIAPCGTDADQDILNGLAEKYYGIDISPTAVEKCPISIEAKVGDILKSGYHSDYFDMIASFLFFHHLHRVGFEAFIREFHRILRKGGILVILEPGNLYPISWLMYIGRKIFGNISGLVPDEAPIFPPKLTSALEKNDFKVEKLQCVSFSHVRIPLPMQVGINSMCKPLERISPFNQMGWMLIWICRKQ